MWGRFSLKMFEYKRNCCLEDVCLLCFFLLPIYVKRIDNKRTTGIVAEKGLKGKYLMFEFFFLFFILFIIFYLWNKKKFSNKQQIPLRNIHVQKELRPGSYYFCFFFFLSACLFEKVGQPTGKRNCGILFEFFFYFK
jgi:hypothetical protein